MGDAMGKLFVNPAIPAGPLPEGGGVIPNDGFGFIQVLFLGACYSFLLLKASTLISEGSELLLLVPSLAGLVGSIVLPVLGAVPDGCIVLFSGLGPIKEAEEQLKVGVGALAGSTVMLITVPWFLSILGGRVPIVDGEACYGNRQARMTGREVLGPCGSMVSMGVSADLNAVRASAISMLTTCLLGYLAVEIPALTFLKDDSTKQSTDIKPFAWTGCIICCIMFVGYLGLQLCLANKDDANGKNISSESINAKAIEVATRKIQDGSLSLSGVLSFFANSREEDQSKMEARLRAVVRPFFIYYDKDKCGCLDKAELHDLVADLGEHFQTDDFNAFFERIDADKSGKIDFEECVRWLSTMVRDESSPARGEPTSPIVTAAVASLTGSDHRIPLTSPDIENRSVTTEEDEDEEGPELPEDVRDMTPAAQRRWVLKTAFWQMGLGTFIVLIVSDPMVDVLNTLGQRTGVPSFYVAFLLAPLASNASEMIASYSYAQKKTRKSITISFAQLLGAACMNNTFCLGIFYMLVAARGLTWTYHAEVCGIIFSQLVVFFFAMRRVHCTMHGLLVLSVLPICLIVVYCLKATAFKDD